MYRILSLCCAQVSRSLNSVILAGKATFLPLLTMSGVDVGGGGGEWGVLYTNQTENSVKPESGFDDSNRHIFLPYSGQQPTVCGEVRL